MKVFNKGFTLIELMIVVAIIAILSVIALPSYHRYVLRSHRVEARNALDEIAQHLQQVYTARGNFNTDSSNNSITGDILLQSLGFNNGNIPAGSSSTDSRYQLQFNNLSAFEFSITATAVNAQAKDTCTSFSINQNLIRTANGSGSPRDQISIDCWRR